MMLKLRNGRMRWGGVRRELDDIIERVKNVGHKLNYLNFGDSGSYILSYE